MNLSPHLAAIRAIIMLQDIDGIEKFFMPFIKGEIQYGTITMVFLIIFIFLMPILLTNLLIGLAVGDIHTIQKNAEIKRMAMVIESYCSLERKMTKSIHDRVMEMEFTSYTDKTVNKSIRT